MASEKPEIKLSAEQEKEGYQTEWNGNNVLVWHRNNQIALLLGSADINKKVQDVIEKKRRDLKDVEAKTGWKAN